MIDPTVWNSIILRITAEQYHFLNRELGITKAKLKLPTLQDVSELIDDLASIAFYEFNNEHQRTARADLALNLVWLFTEAIPKGVIGNPFVSSEGNPNYFDDYDTPEYFAALRLRKIWCEGNFSHQKAEHNLRRTYKRGIEQVPTPRAPSPVWQDMLIGRGSSPMDIPGNAVCNSACQIAPASASPE